MAGRGCARRGSFRRGSSNSMRAGTSNMIRKTIVAATLTIAAAGTAAGGDVTFYKDVLPVLQKNCQDCHRPGQIGPMSLLSYDDAHAWSETIREVVQERRMPPWTADPKH